MTQKSLHDVTEVYFVLFFERFERTCVAMGDDGRS